MKRVCLFVALTLCVTASWSKIVKDSIDSKILGAQVLYNVYLPQGYDTSSDAQYPILYLLHGFTDTYTAWAQKGQLEVVVDELIRSGEVCPMIIVMPNAGGPQTRTTWNGYFNMDGWAYEDFFYQEFLPTVEQRYHAIGDKKHRAISGLSMGGGGSTVYAQRHPDMFCCCYAMSPWLTNDAPDLNPDDKSTYTQRAVHDHNAIAFVRNATDQQKADMNTVRWFFDIGDDDFLLEQTFEFYTEMRRQRIPCELRVRNGIHNWEYWHTALRTSLPFATREFMR